MRRGWRAEAAKTGGYALGVGNLALLVAAEPTTVTLSLAVVLAPFTLALALKLTAFLACSLVSLALGDPRERAELLVCAVGALQPPSAGERYREAMLAEISAAPSNQVGAIRVDLMKTAARTILAAWARFSRRLWKRARPQKAFRAQRPNA
ncbi:MAG TPA: hypothetical protein VE645_09850 [Pseudonocardiaceae bacterium]|jgi:hypothetical protein|nr:hypothetical protein [Pseudonocardiaceae bacterium]